MKVSKMLLPVELDVASRDWAIGPLRPRVLDETWSGAETRRRVRRTGTSLLPSTFLRLSSSTDT